MLVYCSCVGFLSLFTGASRRDQCLFFAPALPFFRCLQVQAGGTNTCLLLLHCLSFADCRCKPAGLMLVYCSCISFLSLFAGACRLDQCLFTAPALAFFRRLQVHTGRTNACFLLLHCLSFADCRCKPAGTMLVFCSCIAFLSPFAGASRRDQCLFLAPALPFFRRLRVQASTCETSRFLCPVHRHKNRPFLCLLYRLCTENFLYIFFSRIFIE